MFADIKENEIINTEKINKILKNLYQSNFFENVSVSLDGKNLKINVISFQLLIGLSTTESNQIKLKRQ